VVFVISVAGGFWFGGGKGVGVPIAAIAVAGACVLAADLLGSPDNQSARIGAALVAGVLFACGWYLGGRELAAAVDECVQHGEELRAVLEEHRGLNGQYPEALDQLVAYELPGNRIFRPSPFEYARTATGYELWFSEGRNRYTASAERGVFSRRSTE